MPLQPAAKATRSARASARPESAETRPVQILASSAAAIASSDALRYSTDAEPGITRRRAGTGFSYRSSDGARLRDEAALNRIRKLAIPPAYRDVWICRDAAGHIQATGIDARGRKQYRYHPQWRAVRDAHKFERMLEFGHALPRIHRRIARDLKLPGMPREKVLATLVRLLETTLIRVGNVEYARSNRSYGLTTLRNGHVKLSGDVMRFRFRGKHGIVHEIEFSDPRAAKVVRKCMDLPGQDLFQYVDEGGIVRDVGSSDVNQYLQDISGRPFTAKDFRTWQATSEALEALAGRSFATAREAKQTLNEILKTIAGKLGNSPAMCRKCYVNPVVVDAFLAGELREHKVRGGLSQRVRLLLILTRTPGGAGFGSNKARRTRPSEKKRPARRQIS